MCRLKPLHHGLLFYACVLGLLEMATMLVEVDLAALIEDDRAEEVRGLCGAVWYGWRQRYVSGSPEHHG